MPTDRDVTDAYIRHAVQLDRAVLGVSNTMAGIARELNDAFMAVIVPKRTRTPAEQGAAMSRATTAYVTDWNVRLVPGLETSAARASQIETTFQVGALETFTGATAIAPNAAALVQASKAAPFQGKVMKDWAMGIAGNTIRAAQASLNVSFASGLSPGETEKALSTVMGRNVRDVRAVARTYVQQYANHAREATLQANNDLISGIQWLATLDNRTSGICQVRDGEVYDAETKENIGGGPEWLSGPGASHWNCRSVGSPKIIGVEDTGYRPAVDPGSDYERGDNLTRTGKVRKPTKPNRENDIYSVRGGPKRGVPAGTNYETWLRAQGNKSPAFVQDILGVERAKLFSDGTPLTSLIDSSTGTPITLDQLSQRGIL